MLVGGNLSFKLYGSRHDTRSPFVHRRRHYRRSGGTVLSRRRWSRNHLRSRARRRTRSSPSTSRCGGARRRTSSSGWRAAAALGFPAVELWPWENKDLNAVADTCERLGLQIAQFTAWGFKPGLNDPKNHAQFVEKIEKGCEVAKKWKCSLMSRRRRRRHPGRLAGEDARDRHRGAEEGRPDRREARHHAHPGADEHPRRSQGPLPVRLRADAEDHQGGRLEVREDQLGPVPHAHHRGRPVRPPPRGLRGRRHRVRPARRPPRAGTNRARARSTTRGCSRN